MNLTEIFDKFKTDKGTIGHGSEAHNYGPFYQEILEPLKNTKASLCELGILNGDSLRSWKEYLPTANIVGIDNQSHKMIQGEDFTTLLGDISNPIGVYDILKQFGLFDVIIDDASHFPHHQQKALPVLFDLVKPGGYYVIEDLHTERLTNQMPDGFKKWYIEYYQNGDSNTTLEFISRIICNRQLKSFYMDQSQLEYLSKSIELVKLEYPKIAYIKKKL